MAYDYNTIKNAYNWLNKQQQDEFWTKYKNSNWYDQFKSDYTAEMGTNSNKNVYTPNTTQKATTWNYTYWDTWWAENATRYTGTGVSGGGNYKYNPNINTQSLSWGALLFWNTASSYEANNPWYLEKRNNALANALYNEWKTSEQAIRNYLNTFDDYRNYDITGQNNTVQAILNRMGTMESLSGKNNWQSLNSQMMNEIMNNYDTAKKGYSELMWGGANYYDNFRDAVDGKLQKAYWIQDLDEFRERYPSQYESLRQALENIEWVWNATNPNERQMLDWQLQGIIWTWVWAGSDISKLNLLEESVLNKFKNPDQIKQDAQNIVKLQTEGKNIKEIANEMWMSEDQVQQLVLLANGLDSKAWEYYQLKDEVAKDITEPYDTKMQRLEEEKKIALDRANRNVEWLKEDFDTNMERQKQQNEISLHNADFLAGQYWYWMSKRGIEWLNYVSSQAQQIIDDLTKNYDRNKQEMADGIADIIRNRQWNNEDLMKASQDALTNAKNSFTSNMLWIQQQYWTVGLQAQQYLAQNVQSFIEQAEQIYDNALTRQQQNLSNLITNVSNLNALAYQDLTLRNAKIEQFQNESMNLNRNQLQSLANQLWMDTASYQDLVNYQVQAVQNQLNGYLPWSWAQMQQQIQSLLDQWYSPNQAMQSIMNSQEFKAMKQAVNGTQDKWSMSGGIMYNQATGEYYDLNGDEYWTIWDKLYNKRTGQIIDANWNTTWGNNYVTSETVDWQTYWVSQQTMQWLQNFYNNHQVWSQWGQCGAFVNDYLQSLGIWRIFTDPIDKKKAQINTPQWYTPQVWDVVVMDSPSQPKYWHVAIVTWVDWNKITTLESNKAWEWKVFTRTIDTSKTKVHWYYHPDGVSAWWVSDWPLTDYGVPISYDRSIKAMIPTQLMNSELELNKLESNIENLYKAWYSAEDAVLQYMWFNINKESDKPIAMNLVNAVRSLSNEDHVQSAVSYISQRINAWDYNWAIKKVENLVRDEAKKQEPDGYFDESTAIWLMKKANELLAIANSMPEDIGVFQWTMQKYLKKLKSSDASKLNTAIAYLTDEQRLRQVWSNVTDHELELVKNWIPQIDDRTDTFINKINQLKQNALTNVNAWRQLYWLPALDEQSLLNTANRQNLYTWIKTTGRWWLSGGWSMSWWGWRW